METLGFLLFYFLSDNKNTKGDSMRYRIISSTYGNNILEHYPMLGNFDLEGIFNKEVHYYITIDTMEDFHDLMNYVGAIVIDNFIVRRDRSQCYYEPTIEIYDGPREGFIQKD